jgi:hypothetical protein
MAEIHLTNINYIEQNDLEGLEFKYKPDVPKLKIVGTLMIAEDEDADDIEGIVFLTQKQLNQLLLNKEIELKVNDDNRWLITKPLTREQSKRMGLVSLDSEYLGDADDMRCYEVMKVSE